MADMFWKSLCVNVDAMHVRVCLSIAVSGSDSDSLSVPAHVYVSVY